MPPATNVRNVLRSWLPVCMKRRYILHPDFSQELNGKRSCKKDGCICTTKSILICNTLAGMDYFTGSKVHGRMQRIAVLVGLFFLFFPVVCSASTLPVQPTLLFEIPVLSAGQGASLTLSVSWNGHGSFTRPPEHIIVEVFSVPDGSRLGSFPIPKVEDSCKSENTCMYRTSVEIRAFPMGTFILAASDPLSGVISRQMISIPPHTMENSEFFKQFDHDRMFSITSVLLGAVLVFVLAILIRQNIWSPAINCSVEKISSR